jgi:hypothetical protein
MGAFTERLEAVIDRIEYLVSLRVPDVPPAASHAENDVAWAQGIEDNQYPRTLDVITSRIAARLGG